MRASGKRATVVSKRRRYYYSPLAHMISGQNFELGPVLRTSASGLSFFARLGQPPLWGVPYGSHDEVSRYFLPHVFLFFPRYRWHSVSAGS
jgi:hypothetical protein